MISTSITRNSFWSYRIQKYNFKTNKEKRNPYFLSIFVNVYIQVAIAKIKSFRFIIIYDVISNSKPLIVKLYIPIIRETYQKNIVYGIT